ncbi:PAS domain-containing sensor histidine kinase [Spirosoma litoris]
METTSTPKHYPFLRGNGKTAAFLRQYDWSKTSLGTPDQWPYSLRVSVSNLLQASLPMFVFWGEEHYSFYNDAVIPSLAPEKHPALGQSVQELCGKDWDFMIPMLSSVRKTGEPVTSQEVPIRLERHGVWEEVYWTFSCSLIFDDHGQNGGVLVNCQDTTEATKSRQQVQFPEQQFRALVEQAPIAIAVFRGSDHIIETANQAYQQLVGRPADELLGKPMFEAMPEIKGKGYEELLATVLATGEPLYANELNAPLKRKGQLELVYFNFVYQPLRAVDGTIRGVTVVANEITEQVLARKKVEESRTHLELLSNTVPAMIFYLDDQQRYQYYNDTFRQWFGVNPTEAIGKTVREFIGEAAYQNVLPHLAIAYGGQQERYELWSPTRMGEGRWLNITYTPYKNKEEQVLGLIVHAADITQTKQRELALRDSEAALRNAIELAELGTWAINAQTGQVTYSERLQTWLGTTEAVLQQVPSPSIHPKDQKRINVAIGRALQKGGTGHFDEVYTILHSKTGHERIIHASGQTTFDADGNALILAGTAQDITMQQALQLALENEVQTRTEELAATNEKLAASLEEYAMLNEELEEANGLLLRSNANLQTFAYVASHDLQEPLRKIQQFGNLLAMRQDALSSEEQMYIERMQVAASRMSTLIRDLLNFSRIATQRDVNKPVPLTGTIHRVLATLDLVISETNAQVEIGSLPTVQGDAAQLDMLFQNLLSNALKFRRADSSGRSIPPIIHINAQTLGADQLPISVKPAWATSAYHQIDVVDNGIGFDEKYLDRIFQVFQRLHGKNEFAGTGIGLAICERVVANHGGAITASSQLGQGARFSVYLPIA